MLLKLLRNALGLLIVLISRLTLPKQMNRSDAEQASAQQQADKLSLYQFYACPFCIKTRRAIHALNIDIEYRDAANDTVHRKELLEKGGQIKVPCLKIEEENGSRWLYESSDIIEYLNQKFAVTAD
ncbi:MAG: glutathione S-transferase N-terminal domain-containing protein [Gammaproteobacteria bacterium]|nr:glutathione S-transferase N-terminal domain-containing protein [Gammaproteobacteria bacterium]